MGKGKFGKGNRPYGQMGKSGQPATWAGALDRLREPDVNPAVPTWNGDPEQFLSFDQDCDWYLADLKENEKPLAVARVWANLRGSARLAVARLNAADFQGVEGLVRLREFLA